MTKVADIRALIAIFRTVAPALSDDEISDIAKVLYAALSRMEKEAPNE